MFIAHNNRTLTVLLKHLLTKYIRCLTLLGTYHYPVTLNM